MIPSFLAAQSISVPAIGLISLAIGLGIFAQSIVGFSAAAIAFPLLLLVMNIQEANAMFGLLLLAFSIIMVWKNRKDIDKKILGELLISTIIGMILGIILLKHIHPLILNKLLGIVTVGYAAYTLIKQKTIPGIERLGWLFGFVGGVLGGLFATGSPAQVMYISNKATAGRVVRATVIAILGVGNLIRVPVMWYEHLITPRTLALSAIAVPAFVIALYAGQKFYHRLNDQAFRYLIIAFLGIAGVILIIK